MRWIALSALALCLCFVSSGCRGIERKHTLKVHTNVKSSGLRAMNEKPGIADCGCSYTVTW